MKFSKGDWIFTAVALLLLFLLSGALYLDFTSGLAAGDRQQVGVLSFKRRTAERKYSGSTLWQGMDADVPVYNMDSIRTASDSEATITLNDGTKISLEDNTMIVLNFVEDQPSIDFGYGAMQAQATGDSDINIKSGDSTISLADSEARISGSEEELELQVQKGEATLKKGDEEKRVQENEVAGLQGNEVKVEKSPLALVSPADQSRFFTTDDRQGISFSWQAEGPVILQVASDRSFSSIVAQAQRAGDAGAAVGPGIYYWRILQNGKSSPVRRFAVYRQQAPVLQMPLGGSEFAYRDSPPLIQFLWSRLDGVTSYRIIVSQNRNLSSPVINEQLVVNSISRNLGPGTYYWQIQPISATEGMASNSGLGSFTVSQQSEIAAPIPLSPVNATFVEEVIKKNGLNFAWKQDKEISGVQFQLASDAGFQNTIASTRVSGNVYAFRGELRPGTYYWRLSGAGFPASRVVSFSVADKERLEAVVPAPGQTVTSLARNVDIRFAWKGGAGNYRILVSQSQDLNNAKVASTTARSLTVQGLEGGTYFWKVQKLGSEGEVLGESALLNFKIERKLDKPVLIAPAPGSVVDMTDLDRLIFRWRPVEGARSYTLKVFQIDGTGQKLILTRQVAGAAFEFTDLKLLDESLFRYTVEANAPGLEGEAAQATFRISLQLEKKPEFITPEVIFK